MADLVVKKACKESVKPMRCPDSTVDALDKLVKEILKKASKRAEENGRKTITAYDL